MPPALAAAAQADDDAVYRAHCAACHGATLQGGSFGPSLIDKAFHDKWTALSTNELLNFISTKMPPAAPGSLSKTDYAAVTAFLSRRNALAPASAATLPATLAEGSSKDHYADHMAKLLGFGAGIKPDQISEDTTRARQALIDSVTPVTDAMLKHPADGDWVAWRRTTDTLGYSPLKQIDRSNVKRLAVAWSLSLSPGTNGIAPLVHDGVMFLNASGKVQALDARNGDLLWEYAGNPGETTRTPISQPRQIALYGDKLYVPTLDGHVIALNAKTGAVVWDHLLYKPEDQLELTAGPLVVRGKVIQGVSGCQGSVYKGGCYIVALDAATGAEAWRFHTLARADQPGGDSWNGAPVEERFGGSVWTPGSYDPDLGLVYFGTAQTYKMSTLLRPNTRRGASTDALFTDSTLALDPDTGKLVWYYQHLPGDVWDLDWVFEQSIVTLPRPKGPRKVVISGGKIGLFDALDAKTGRYLFSADMGLQDLVTAIDPRTGHKTINPKASLVGGRTASVCPFIAGARNWPATAYDPESGLLYVPLVESCMETRLPMDSETGKSEWTLKRRPDSNGKYGRLSALDVKTGRIVWTNRYRTPAASAALATAGGIVFAGTRDRTFRALDGATGETLWETGLNETPDGFPISYSVGNVQYVTVIAGGGTPLGSLFRAFTPEIQNSTGARTIWTFRLADR